MLKKLPVEVQFIVKCYAFNLALFSAFRLFFVVKNWPEIRDESTVQVIWTFVLGLRFDASIISYPFGFLILLLLVPNLRHVKAWKGLVAILCSVVTAAFFLLLVADVIYYESQKRKLGYEVFAYMDAGFGSILKTGLNEFPVLFLASLVATLAAMWLQYRYLKKSTFLGVSASRPKVALLSFIASVVFAVLTIRGGVQRIRLRVGDQMISKNQTINAAVASSPFLAFHSYFDRNLQRIDLIPSNEAIAHTQKLLSIEPTQLINPEYPLFIKRRECDTSTVPQYNVVVMLLESWSGKYIGQLGDTLNVTPEFNALAKEGLFFDRFFAEGFRTTAGLFTTLAGIPDQTDRSVLRRLESQNRFGSLSTMLKSRGYEMLFVHGGLLDFDNMQSFLRKEAFDTIIGKQHLKGSGGVERSWGFDDQFTLRRANEEFQKAKQPFFGMTLSVSTHVPYELPENAERIYSEDKTPDWKFLNAYRYADWAVGDFFRLAKQAPYFKNTIFILVADHTHHSFIDDKYTDQHIPFLIYAPGIVQPGTRHTVGSHSDIVPTVSALLDLPYQASMGRDLLKTPEDDGFAFWIDGHNIGWITDKYLARMNTQVKKIEVYDHTKRDFKTDLTNSNPQLAADSYKNLASWFQTSFDLIRKNKILPRDFNLNDCK